MKPKRRRRTFVSSDNQCGYCNRQFFKDRIPDICPTCKCRLLIDLSILDLDRDILHAKPLSQIDKQCYSIWNGNRCARCGGYVDEAGICGNCFLQYDNNGNAFA